MRCIRHFPHGEQCRRESARHGARALLDATAAPVIREIKERDPTGKWAAYSSTHPAQFVKAQGVNVVNGLNYVPDLPFCRQLDPSGKYDAVYNRYALSGFLLAGGTREFRLAGPVLYSVDVSPLDPVLVANGVRYAVLFHEVRRAPERGMRLLSQPPGTQLWIYEIIGTR